MAIDWTPVTVRVPDDRREVLCWGLPLRGFMGVNIACAREALLGVSRCNVGRERHLFDIERKRRWIYGAAPIVTHWAEITGPVAQTLPHTTAPRSL